MSHRGWWVIPSVLNTPEETKNKAALKTSKTSVGQLQQDSGHDRDAHLQTNRWFVSASTHTHISCCRGTHTRTQSSDVCVCVCPYCTSKINTCWIPAVMRHSFCVWSIIWCVTDGGGGSLRVCVPIRPVETARAGSCLDWAGASGPLASPEQRQVRSFSWRSSHSLLTSRQHTTVHPSLLSHNTFGFSLLSSGNKDTVLPSFLSCSVLLINSD